MNIIAEIALYGFIFFALAVFSILPPRKAVITCLLIGWLFLPVAGIRFYGLPNFTKYSAIAFACLTMVAVFDTARLLSFRPHWVDLPILVWCFCPMASSLANNLGMYDGASETTQQILTWGIPYLMGRLYFADLPGLRAMLIGILVISIIYVPLCLWEARTSPQLHRQIYGFMPSSFLQQIRGGGYRPVVFIGHGLGVSAWMSMAVVIAVWVWKTGATRHVLGLPNSVAAAIVSLGLLVTRSVSGLILTTFGAMVLWSIAVTRTTLPFLLLCLLPFVYVATRAIDVFPTQPFINAAAVVSDARAQSLEFRFDNEERLVKKAMGRPIFGWGGWGRSRVYDQYGKDISVTDGLWIIAIGKHGAVGVVSLLLVYTLPPILVARRLPATAWRLAEYAPVAITAVLLLLTAINALPNAPSDPIRPALAGGLGALALQLRMLSPRRVPQADQLERQRTPAPPVAAGRTTP